jgi:two-component system sensor histidine kinase BaeS
MTAMRLSITFKLFVILVIASTFIVGSLVWIIQRSFDRGFLRYVNTVEETARARMISELETAFTAHWGWPRLDLDSMWRENRMRAYAATRDDTPQSFQAFRRLHPVIVDSSRALVLPPHVPDFDPAQYDFRPLHQGRDVIGYVGFPEFVRPSNVNELRFLQQQTRTFATIAVLTIGVCMILALPFSRQLVRPVKRLSHAARALAAGRYDVRISAHSSDEIGQLSRDFNHLAQTLEKHEHARQQWMADIAHELRTPLAVMLANLEAIEDGVRRADAEQIKQLHGQVIQLTRVVNDLHELSMADIGALNYQMELVSLPGIVHNAVQMTRTSLEAAGIRVDERPPPVDLKVLGDVNRLQQLFGNLLSNTLAYTDRGGQLRISITQQADRAVVDFEDSAPGVPESALPRLFDRLYRVDTSRSRAKGGSGLGLAICASIVEAHHGEISARHSPLGGLWIRVSIPVAS